MQLDVNVSPPANIMTFRHGLTHVTFDLHPCNLWPNFMILGTVVLEIWIIAQEFLSSHRRTESDAYEPTVQISPLVAIQ